MSLALNAFSKLAFESSDSRRITARSASCAAASRTISTMPRQKPLLSCPAAASTI